MNTSADDLPASFQAVLPDLRATGRAGVIREMTTALHPHCPPGIHLDTLADSLLEREKVRSTGCGNGAAIPHVKVPGLDRFLLCLGRSRQGIPFEAHDNHPVHLFILILGPETTAASYLSLLGKISRRLRQDEVRNTLLESSDPAVEAEKLLLA